MKSIDFFQLVLRLLPLLLALWVHLGCGHPDQRLADFAERAVSEQSQQNAAMARQSEAIVAESHQLAEAALELVEQDAQARRELIAAGERMTARLGSERAGIDQERRQLARLRLWDSLLAEAVRVNGGLLACLLPLLLTALILWQMRNPEPDDAAVAALLLDEMTSDRPVLLPAPAQRRLSWQEDPCSSAPPFDPEPDNEPPF